MVCPLKKRVTFCVDPMRCIYRRDVLLIAGFLCSRFGTDFLLSAETGFYAKELESILESNLENSKLSRFLVGVKMNKYKLAVRDFFLNFVNTYEILYVKRKNGEK